MKKQLLLLLVFSVFFLSGCTSTSKLSQDQLFEKKQECESYKSQMEEDAKIYYWEIYIWVTNIFYSPTRNSCLYVAKIDYKETSLDIADMSIEVHDFLTKETLWIATPDNIKTLKN